MVTPSVGCGIIMLKPIVCVGQMRSGTTWLWEALKSSPECWSAPLKELRLLNEIEEIGETTCAQRLDPHVDNKTSTLSSWRTHTWLPYLDAMAAQIGSWDKSYFYKRAGLEAEFWFKYFGLRHNLDLYEDLVRLALPGRLLDFSPLYMACREQTLEAFAQRFPGAQIIIQVRNPFDRLISLIRWGAGSSIELPCSEDADVWLNSFPMRGEIERQTNTRASIEKIFRVFARDRVFVAVFDDLLKSPQQYVKSICEFLNVSPAEGDLPTFTNARPDRIEIDRHLQDAVRKIAMRDAIETSSLLGGLTNGWADTIAEKAAI